MKYFRAWDDQLERMERYYQRCETIKNRGITLETVDDDDDTVNAFFLNCLHLKDWFKRDYLYTHGEKYCANRSRCAECYLQATPELKICQDIANGIQHLNRTSAKSVRQVNMVTETAELFVESREGQRLDAFKVVSDAREAWKRFVLLTRAIESEETYRSYYAAGSKSSLV